MPNPLPRERYPLMIGVLTGLINPGNLALLIIVAVVAAAVSYFSRHHLQPSRV